MFQWFFCFHFIPKMVVVDQAKIFDTIRSTALSDLNVLYNFFAWSTISGIGYWVKYYLDSVNW